MNTLTEKELGYINNLTNKYSLGTKLQEIINHAKLIETASAPVNAIAAKETLTLTGVVIDGQTVTVHNPLIEWDNVYEFLADADQSKSDDMNIGVDISASTTKATNTLTIATQPTAGDTMVIGSKTFTFVPNGTANANGEISIGTNLPTAKAAIIAAINGTDEYNDPHPQVTAGVFTVDVLPITALVGGAAGNAIGTTETFTAVGNVFSAVTLATGADCSAANAITALVAANALYDNQGVTMSDGAGDTVVFTADVAGIAGNDIAISETLANGSFALAAIKLSGGVNGTPGNAHELRSDGSYLYVCTAANTIAGANWRRVSLGSVY